MHRKFNEISSTDENKKKGKIGRGSQMGAWHQDRLTN
jgi:hypothetical protein